MQPIRELIGDMIAQGFSFECGPHAEGNLKGFYAIFFRHIEAVPCDFCEGIVFEWDRAGHDLNLDDAIVMARDIALNPGTVTIPPATLFE